jgi:flagellar L-ring protein precursor FlgH
MTRRAFRPILLALPLCAVAGVDAQAQSSSLYGPPEARPPLTLEDSSWLYLSVPVVRDIQLHDLVTIIVLESSQVQKQGNISRRTQSNIDANLQNWIKFDHFGIKPDLESEGDPRIRGTLNSQLRTTAQLDTADTIKFRVTAQVVDIRPNGNLVLEAHSSIRDNDEVREESLSGIVRREDILPNNTVLSEKVYELRVEKRDKGQVRDAYRQGWLLKFLDNYKPI